MRYVIVKQINEYIYHRVDTVDSGEFIKIT